MARTFSFGQFEILMKQHFGATEVLREDRYDTYIIVGGVLDGERLTSAFLYDMFRDSTQFAKVMQWLLERAESIHYAKYAVPSFIIKEDGKLPELMQATRRYAPSMGSVNDVQRSTTPFWRSQVVASPSGEPGSTIVYRPTTAGGQKPKPERAKPKEESLDKPVVPKRHFT